MILLSALLASLTGLVAGERSVPRAQLEQSAVTAIAQTDKASVAVQTRPANVLPIHPAAFVWIGLFTLLALPLRSVGARLSLKQSWLH